MCAAGDLSLNTDFQLLPALLSYLYKIISSHLQASCTASYLMLLGNGDKTCKEKNPNSVAKSCEKLVAVRPSELSGASAAALPPSVAKAQNVIGSSCAQTFI